MTVSDELAYATATELADRIRRRQLSPVELLDAVIARIEARNPSLNAFVFTAFDEARDRAKQAERALTSGAALGPLHGVPTALKDLFDFKPGWPATFGGVRALREFSVPAHCTYAERMEAAGAILVGKTNSPVMGFRGTCDNYLFGPSRNPFDTTKNTGGSSGGSAAAVADGLLPLSEATDGGGSVRIPASWCGLYGFKASFGRVPYTGRPDAFGSLNPFLYEGAVTRTVDDSALALDVLAGYDDRDPFALDDPVSLSGATRRSIRGWRIAYSPDFGAFPVDRRVAGVVQRAVQAFEEAGAVVEEVALTFDYDQRELSDLWCRLITPLNIEGLEGLKEQGVDLLGEHRDDFPPEYLRWIDEGYRMSALDVRRSDDLLDRQVRPHRVPGLADLVALVGLQPVDGVAVLPREDRHRADAELVGGAERPDGDLTPVGHQRLADHDDSPSLGGAALNLIETRWTHSSAVRLENPVGLWCGGECRRTTTETVPPASAFLLSSCGGRGHRVEVRRTGQRWQTATWAMAVAAMKLRLLTVTHSSTGSRS
jgi:amidase